MRCCITTLSNANMSNNFCLSSIFYVICIGTVQFSSLLLLSHVWLFVTPWTTGLPVHHQLPEFTQTHVHWVGDAIQPSHPLLSSSPPTFNLSQHQDLFKWVSSSHQVVKVLEFKLQHQSFQWIVRTYFLQDGLTGSAPVSRLIRTYQQLDQCLSAA